LVEGFVVANYGSTVEEELNRGDRKAGAVVNLGLEVGESRRDVGVEREEFLVESMAGSVYLYRDLHPARKRLLLCLGRVALGRAMRMNVREGRRPSKRLESLRRQRRPNPSSPAVPALPSAASCQTCAMRHAATHDKSLADWRSATATCRLSWVRAPRLPLVSNGALLRRRPVNSSCDNDVFAINLTCCSDAIAAVAVHQSILSNLFLPGSDLSFHLLPCL
ncbi:hypothetical protein KCU99_g42, partial [Aureobasidium melanogenum]